MTTFLPYGSFLAGVKTSTLSPSAKLILPAMALAPTVTVNAAFVVALSMALVNLTEMAASRATADVSSRGRNRTTPGAATVRTSSIAGSIATPSASMAP